MERGDELNMKNKLFKKILFGLFISAVVLIGVYLLTARQTVFNFANDGKIICVEHRDWGLIGKGNLTCFEINPLGQEKKVQTYKCSTLNGEIVLTK